MVKSILFAIILVVFFQLSHAQNHIWSAGISSTGTNISNSITVDSEGNTYTAGIFSNTADFDPSVNQHLITAYNGYDFFIQKLNFNGELEWVKRIGGQNSGEFLGIITTDNADNIYFSASFHDTLNFNPGGTPELITPVDDDVFILKMNSDGDFIWVKTLSGATNSDARDLKIDSLGNIFITGGFTGSINIDPNGSNETLTSNGGQDAYFVQLDSLGNLVSKYQIGGSGNDIGTGIAFDGENVYCSGHFSGTVDFDMDTSQYLIASKGSSDAFICKTTYNDELVWVNTISGTGMQESWGIEYINNSLFSTGLFAGVTYVEFNNLTDTLYSVGDRDIFVTRCTDSGDLQWVKGFGGTWREWIQDIKVDNEANIYLTGSLNNTVNFGTTLEPYNIVSNGSAEGFIAKFDSTGMIIWAGAMGGLANDHGRSIALFNNSRVFVSGEFQDVFDYDNTISQDNLVSAGQYDGFLISIDNIDLTTNVKNLIPSSTYHIYPNPTSGLVNINSKNAVTYILYDVLGKVIMEERNKSFNHNFNIDNLESGVYFLLVNNGKLNTVSKIIKD